jgi:hypothetical protein
MKLLRLEKTSLLIRKSINRPQLRSGLFLVALALAYPALSPITQAVTPPPVGGYPGQNTATGDYALFNLTTGTRNTAIGFWALNTNTTGGKNTAIGFQWGKHRGRPTCYDRCQWSPWLNNVLGAFQRRGQADG